MDINLIQQLKARNEELDKITLEIENLKNQLIELHPNGIKGLFVKKNTETIDYATLVKRENITDEELANYEKIKVTYDFARLVTEKSIQIPQDLIENKTSYAWYMNKLKDI